MFALCAGWFQLESLILFAARVLFMKCRRRVPPYLNHLVPTGFLGAPGSNQFFGALARTSFLGALGPNRPYGALGKWETFTYFSRVTILAR